MRWADYFTPKIRKLGSVCVTTFFIGYGASYIMYRYAQTKIVRAPHCTQALDVLASHQQAVNALGAPVAVDSNFKFADRRYYRVNADMTFWKSLCTWEDLGLWQGNHLVARHERRPIINCVRPIVKLPVQGSLDVGHLYVNGLYEDDEKFQITSMELSLKRLEKRFKIFELPEDEIRIKRTVDKAEDEDDMDEHIATTAEKGRWFNFSWLSREANI